MDSLFATYASSDDEEEENHHQQNPNLTIPSNTTSPFLSLPKPKSSSSSLSFSLTPPKSPISQTLNHQNSTIKDILKPNKRVVVQFKPPVINPYLIKDDDDDDEEDRLAKRRNSESNSVETHSLKSFLSSIPAPRNAKATLGALPTSSSRKSVTIDADIPALKIEKKIPNVIEGTSIATSSTWVHEENLVDGQESNAAYGALDAQSMSIANGGDSSSWIHSDRSYVNYDASYESYGGNGVGQYDSNSYDGSGTALQEMTKSLGKNYGKRGRNEIPTNIIEVKQDELMKNRPREDQVKATGIAFGPSYQPVSTKGKPTKLHKRKHQIGSLYFDMKQNEMELSERRSKGMLTKAETHAKYGW